MPYSLEDNMITVLKNCIRLSELMTQEHYRIVNEGFFTLATFSSEAWRLRTRNEELSSTKRDVLTQLVGKLEASREFHRESGQTLANTLRVSDEKSKLYITSEINVQISQYHGLGVILKEAKQRIIATITLRDDGGESLKAIRACETLLEAAMIEWIAQMQQDGLHKNGTFPVKFEDTRREDAGTHFEHYMRDLINHKKQIPTTTLYDPRAKVQSGRLLMDSSVSGVRQSSAINTTSSVVSFSGRPTRSPPPVPGSLSSSSLASSVPTYDEPPPPYYVEPDKVDKPVDGRKNSISKLG